jgi:hypothetical protein
MFHRGERTIVCHVEGLAAPKLMRLHQRLYPCAARVRYLLRHRKALSVHPFSYRHFLSREVTCGVRYCLEDHTL